MNSPASIFIWVNLSNSLKKLFYKRKITYDVLQVGAIYFLALLFQFLTDIIFGRHLSINDYGRISFNDQLVTFAITITFLGIDSSLVRVISKKDLKNFKWKSFANKMILFFSIISVVITLIIKIIYSISLLNMFIIWSCSTFGSGSLLYAALLRSNSNFFKSQISVQFWKIVLCIGAISLILLNSSSFYYALIIVFAAFFCNFIISFIFIYRYPEGKETISIRTVYVEGLLFGINSGILMLTSAADQFVIVKILGYQLLSPYVASWNVIGMAYILISTSIGYVIVPPLIQKKLSYKTIKALFWLTFLIGAITSIFVYQFSSIIIKIAYAGKFDTNSTLTLLFIFIGLTRLIYVFPSALITAWGTTRNIGEFSLIGAGGVALNFIICFILVPGWGLIGAAIGSLVGWLFRLLLGFIQTNRIYKNEVSNIPKFFVFF